MATIVLLPACTATGQTGGGNTSTETSHVQQRDDASTERTVMVTLRVDGTGTGLVRYTESPGLIATNDVVLTGWVHEYVAAESAARELEVQGRSRNAALRCFIAINGDLVVTAKSDEGQVNCSASHT